MNRKYFTTLWLLVPHSLLAYINKLDQNKYSSVKGEIKIHITDNVNLDKSLTFLINDATHWWSRYNLGLCELNDVWFQITLDNGITPFLFLKWQSYFKNSFFTIMPPQITHIKSFSLILLRSPFFIFSTNFSSQSS